MTIERSGIEARGADRARWRAVLARDPAADGGFVFAVRTTGIYCRPSCPARRPRRERVAFFAGPDAAERAGYRACRRCHPREASEHAHQVEIVRAACRMLDGPAEAPLPLARLARRIGYSPWHLHRLFKRHTGLTPREYARARRDETFKRHLKEGAQVTTAILDAGFSSPGAAYRRGLDPVGMTPSAYAGGGTGQAIASAVVRSPLGWLLVAVTRRGVCAVRFGNSRAALERAVRAEFPAALHGRATPRLRAAVRAALAAIGGRAPAPGLPLDVRATAFQRRVWQALRAIPRGETRSYGAIARAIGRPRAARAVGAACGANPVAVLVPCHRAVRGDGAPGGYAYGVPRKRALLAREKRA